MHRESHQKDALQYGSSANRRRCFSILYPADTGAKLFGNSVTTLFLPDSTKKQKGRIHPLLYPAWIRDELV